MTVLRPAGWFAIGAVCALVAALVAWTGGLDVRLAGIPLRSRSWDRPAALALVCGLIGLYGLRHEMGGVAARLATAAERGSTLIVVLAACVAGVISVAYGTRVAGGSDSSGYVSQAALLAQGRLTDTYHTHPAFTWPETPATFAPLGYAAGRQSGTLVPTYPPGLPLLMAPLAAIDERAVFFVVPVTAVLAVWLCGLAGRTLAGPLAGALAASLLATSPTFLYHAVQPMSDVPVTACWLGALLLAQRSGSWAAAAAGFTASLAVLIRPNLAPLVVLVAACTATAPHAGRTRAWWYLLGVAPGIVALGTIQLVRYGSAIATGYGAPGHLFAVTNVAPNAWQYARWLTGTHTPFIWMWLVAPLWIATAPRAARRTAWIYLGFIVAIWLAYLPYGVFNPEEWHYTRFFLPAVPLMLVVGIAAVLMPARRAPSHYALPAVLLLAAALGAVYLSHAAELGVFELRVSERRYPAVAAYVRDRLPEHTLVVADQHSGSIRYYARRPILRWPLLAGASLDAVLTGVREAGYVPYLVLDPFEEPGFRERFRPTADAGTRLRLAAIIEGTRIYAFE